PDQRDRADGRASRGDRPGPAARGHLGRRAVGRLGVPGRRVPRPDRRQHPVPRAGGYFRQNARRAGGPARGRLIMTVLTGRGPAGHYRFRHAAQMEWIKLRTLRSSWWTLAITAAGAAAMAVTIGLNTISRSADLTNNVLAGIVPGLLLTGVLGVLV